LSDKQFNTSITISI